MVVAVAVRLGVGLGLEADLATRLKSWFRVSLSPLLPSLSSRQLLLITTRRPALEFYNEVLLYRHLYRI